MGNPELSWDPGLDLGQTITAKELHQRFSVSHQGGMRRAHSTNSLVLVTSDQGPYSDRWEGDVLHYTGEGRTGPQRLDHRQNRTLKESGSNGVNVFLFRQPRRARYTFLGRVELDSEPYQEEQPDVAGEMRSVWVFPLQILAVPPISWADFEELERERQEDALSQSDAVLRRHVRDAPPRPPKRTVTSEQFERSPYIAEFAKRWARGHCTLCRDPAPFETEQGPYLEAHHIVWLSRGGRDEIANVAAVCPNCHVRLHRLDLNTDRELLLERVADEVSGGVRG